MSQKSELLRQAAIKAAEERYILFIERWQAGLELGMKGTTSTSGHIRRYLFQRAENSCEKCGWNKINPVTQKCPLEINHKDGNFRNNRENNLELLCPNCHSLTSNFRSLNIGRGRPRRSDRVV